MGSVTDRRCGISEVISQVSAKERNVIPLSIRLCATVTAEISSFIMGFPSLSTEEVVTLLERLDLSVLAEGVRENAVTGEDLRLLTDAELQSELGWNASQISKIREGVSFMGGEPASKNASDGPDAKVVDFMSPFVPHPSDDFRKVRYVATRPLRMHVPMMLPLRHCMHPR